MNLNALLCISAILSHVLSTPRKSATDIPDHTFRETGCRLLIDEINLFTENTDVKQYIELSRYCEDNNKWSKSADMKGGKLLFIAADGYLIGVCSFEGTRLKERENIVFMKQGNKRIKQIRKYWSYLIGTDIWSPDLKRENCQLVPSGRPSENPKFPTGVDYPVGLALIYNEKPKVLENVKLNKNGGQYIRTEVDSKMRAKITKYLQDFYQYGSKTMYQFCRYFSLYFVYPEEVGILLRDWFVHNQTDFGLSRCSSLEISKRTMPFQPSLFKYATPTPGEPNHCNDALDFSIDSLLPYRNVSNDVYLGELTLPCKSFLEDQENTFGVITSDLNYRNQLALALSENVNENSVSIFEGDNQTVCHDLVETVNVNTNAEFTESNDICQNNDSCRQPKYKLNIIDQIEFERNLEMEKPFVWYENGCDRFPTMVLNEIASLEGSPMNTKDILQQDVCYWFHFIPETKKFICRLCKTLLLQNIIFERPNSVMITDMMTTGVMDYHFKNRWGNNRKKMMEHKDSIYHQLSVQWFKLYDSGLRSTELQNTFENEPGPFFDYISSTRAMIAITKQAVEIGLSFYNFEKLTDLLKYFHVDIGHLYSNGNGIRAIIESLSDSMHQEFVEYLLKVRPKLSLLLDGTSDISSETIVAILFMVEGAEEGNFIKLYKILHLREGEKGDVVFDSLKNELDKDGLSEFFQNSLVSVTSDGGLNIFNVFNRRMNNFTGRTIMKHWCDNHRESLLYRNTVRKFPELQNVATVVNKAHKTYSKSPKSKSFLRDLTIKQGGHPFEWKRTHEIRWVSGNLRAYKTFVLNWKYITKATEAIKNNLDFNSKARSTAYSLLRDLTDPIFLSHLGFLYDIGRVIGDMSLQVEKRGATLIAKTEMRVQFLGILKSMKNRPTETVQSFILSSVSSNNSQVVSLQEFEKKPVTFNGFRLSSSRNGNGFYLFENQNKYIDEFIAQNLFYFPEDPRDGFDVFDPRKFPNVVNDSKVYGTSDILKLNQDLNWGLNSMDLSQDWKVLLVSIVAHSKFKEMQLKTPEDFWRFFLKPSSNASFKNTTRDMMAKVLLVSASNAETERVLGIYTRTKTKQRYLLYPKTVESILRVKINGEKNLNELNTMKYAKAFIMRGHSRANDLSRRGKRLSREDWDQLITENDVDINETENIQECDAAEEEGID
ncbi:unnamed protein product [Allacma fusca]|uniref:Uncharacterized protein n=1 Tax=Allacma fusca TaxID=39272 RepID=A0A8J2K157_9HEXA|nr:unnamed protein product [Allacma fusca]